MITAADVYGQGDVVGFQAQAIIVVLVVGLGLLSLITWDRRGKAADQFAEDFIPHASDVAASERKRIHQGWL